ncbi:MAG: hypothetical protein ACREC9_05180 [Methylocella sp.]
MHDLVFGKARVAARTLLARLGHVWIWPGIPLTEKRGAACVPIAADDARFWITRLHGPEANDSTVLRCLDIAAQKLNESDEAGAQNALDANGLTRLSSDGTVLMRAVASSLGIAPLDLPWEDGPRLWRAEVIDAHLPFFKEHAPAVDLLAKAGVWDEPKHPRWPAGSPDHQGARFNYGEGEADAGNDSPNVEGRSALESGHSPESLTKELAFERTALDVEKYNPDQPRVPAGSGRESGQWTLGDSGQLPTPEATPLGVQVAQNM